MNKQVIVTTLLLFGRIFTKADNQELVLNQPQYLHPLSHKLNNSYLPPPISKLNNSYFSLTKEKQHQKPNEHTKLSKKNFDYQYNQPKVIDDPLPTKVDYVKPLGINFVKDKYKPVIKETLISGLFLNIFPIQSIKEGPVNWAPINIVINMCEKSHESKLTKSNVNNALISTKHDSKAESSLKNNKYTKNSLGSDVAPTSYLTDTTTEYKLFNYDDDNIELSGFEPVVIFKPRDDITFTEDTILDDFEHNISQPGLNKEETSLSTKEDTTTTSTTTTLPSSKQELDKYKISVSMKEIKPLTTRILPPLLTADPSFDPYSSEAPKYFVAGEKSKSNSTGYGYTYDKPKIPFSF